jgi:hypothetical protein
MSRLVYLLRPVPWPRHVETGLNAATCGQKSLYRSPFRNHKTGTNAPARESPGTYLQLVMVLSLERLSLWEISVEATDDFPLGNPLHVAYVIYNYLSFNIATTSGS